MDVTPVQVLLMGLFIGLVLGTFPFFLTMRDFVGAYFSVRFGKGKRLLAVHSSDGINLFWKVGYFKDGIWMYNHSKKDKRPFTISDGCVKRSMGVNILHIDEGVTAPFNFKLVKEVVKEVDIPKLDKDLKEVKDKEGNLVTEVKSYVETIFFKTYDDSRTLIALLESALSKKSSKASLSLGSVDFKKLLIIAVIVIGGWFVIKNFVLTGDTNIIK